MTTPEKKTFPKMPTFEALISECLDQPAPLGVSNRVIFYNHMVATYGSSHSQATKWARALCKLEDAYLFASLETDNPLYVRSQKRRAKS